MRKIFTVLLVLGLFGGLSSGWTSFAQDQQPVAHERPAILEIDRAYFPESEYSGDYAGMIIPDGDGPVCPVPSTLPNDGWTNTEPTIDDRGLGCRMPGLVTFGGADTLGFSTGSPRRPKKDSISSASPNATTAYYTNLNDCRDSGTPCTAHNEGINKVYFSLSAKKPILNYGSASDIHFGNRMHFGGRLDGTTITCTIDGVLYTIDPNLALISGWGKNRVNTISGDMKLIYEVWDSDYCTQIVTAFTIPQNLAVYAKFYRVQNPSNTNDAQWRIQIWWNNQWTTVTTQWISFDEAMYLDYGLEYDATGGDYDRATIQRNFVGNVSYKTDKLQTQGYTYDSYPFDSSFPAFYPNWYNNYYYAWNTPFTGLSTLLQPNDQSSMMARSIN